jgi:branched-chain amino acid transport system ATP-binding protein
VAQDLLSVSDLHAGYGKAEVLSGIALRAAEGSVVTVIGPNGAGKSTLLNALMGVLPARGRLAYKGENIGSRTLEERVLHGIALVPERRELFGTMSVEDNLILGGFGRMRGQTMGGPTGRLRGRLRGWRTIQDELGGTELRRVYTLFPRLEERRRQLAGTLSGGERQMLAIGRALMGKPRLLMLDEPSLGLAPLVVRDIFSVIGDLRKTGVTILLVEQNARAALELADYGYVLETGAIALEGSARELAGDPRVLDTYLGAKRVTGEGA